MIEFTLLVLIIVANGSPILTQKLLGERWQSALDGGRCLKDGRPVFGPTKTWRGVVSACLFTGLVAWMMHWSVMAGLLIALGAMTGDLLSSFIKRRLGMVSSSRALGLDQIPESLLPLLLLKGLLVKGLSLKVFSTGLLPQTLQADMTWTLVWQVVVMFFIAELLLSRILFHLHIRNQPY